MQLRDARFVHAQLGADVLHRHFVVVVEGDHPLLARRQRRNCVADAVAHFLAFVFEIRTLRLRRHQHRRQLRLVDGVGVRERRRGFDGVDADDGLAEPLLIRSDRLREIGQRGLVSERGTQLLARRFELASHAPHAARPRVLAQRIDHRAADAPLGEGFELDAARIVKTMRRINQTNYAVLHQITEVDRMRHRRGHSPGERFHKRYSCFDSLGLAGSNDRSLR